MFGILDAGFLLLFVALLVWFVDDKFIGGKYLPPGPLRVPILGTVALIRAGAKGESPYITFKSWSEKYGPIISSKFGSMWQVIVDDPKTMTEVLEGNEWVERPVNSFMQERSFGKQLGILWGNGEEWRELRRFSIRTLRDFGFGKQMSQEVMMELELKELLEGLNSKIQQDNNVVNMEQFFTVSVLNIIWSMIAGFRFSHNDEQIRTLIRNISSILRSISGGGNILMAFPSLRHILKHFPGPVMRRTAVIGQLQNDFQNILMERRKEGYYKEDQRDFIDVFLAEIDKQHNGNNKQAAEVFTDQQFITTLLDLFIAGSETTANSSEFAILYMILNPDVQKKVQAEIDLVVGPNRLPNANDRLRMPYTEATLHEVQRMANVVPIIPRVPTKDTNLHGYRIKKGTFTVLNMVSYHYNPQLWENPNKFSPERFLNSKMEIVNTEKLHVFGGGKRICLGEVLARATLFTYFATLMQNYTFEASPCHPKPTSENPKFGFTMAPQPYFSFVKPRMS